MEELGAEVVSLGRTDVFIPIDTEAVSAKDAEAGRAWSKTYGFNAIISTDGDGDRPLMSDEHGNWLRGDIVGLLSAQYLGINVLAVPVSCNSAIELSGSFDKVVRTRIGSPYVIAEMQDMQVEGVCVAGFEANGGFLLGSVVTNSSGRKLLPLPTRDAILPVLAVLANARQNNCTVSALIQSLPKRYTSSDRLQNIPVQLSTELLKKWTAQPELFGQLMGEEFDLPLQKNVTDGLRFTFSNGIVIHLRPSGNAPELRCYSEASSQSHAEELAQDVLLKVRSTL